MARILVTGASGFIGGHVVDNLHAKGHSVIHFDRLVDRKEVDNDDVYICGDICDAGVISEAIERSDGVIHLAGVLGTSETIKAPIAAVNTNIIGGLNVLDAIKRHNKKAVYICVGNWWFKNTYSISKTTMENFCYMYNNEFGTQVAVVRALNAYGKRQHIRPVRKITPNFIVPCLKGEPITIYGSGESYMDMVPVEFIAETLVRALLVEHNQYTFKPERNVDSTIKFDCGSGRRTTVNDIAEAVIKAVGQGSVVHVPMRGGEQDHSEVMGDPETLRPLFDGQVPEIESLESGLARTVDWYRNHPEAW